MNYLRVSVELGHNKEVFRGLFHGADRELYTWRPAPDKWCMLEIICHLYDEECEDFRARVEHVLLHGDRLPMQPIDPQGWVTSRSYMLKDYETILHGFLAERQRSVNFLNALSVPQWDNVYNHPVLGPLKASTFLYNWLAHDHHHIRQVNDLKYRYLASKVQDPLTYAGKW